jgi:hypothetical protein
MAYSGSYLEIYPLSLPMAYLKTPLSSLNKVTLTLSDQPSSYFSQGQILFAYLYLSNVYSATRIAAVFPYLSNTFYGYTLNYARFNYHPADGSLLLAVKTYSTSSSPFLKLNTFKDFTGSGLAVDQFVIGYDNVTSGGAAYTADVFLLNASTSSCPEQQYLYYLDYFSSLPLACRPCHPTCRTCLVPALSTPGVTD